MKKARWILAAVLLVLLTCAGFYCLHDDARPGVTRANFDRIEDGMIYDEVEAIFGRKPAQVFEAIPVLEALDGEKQRSRTCAWKGSNGEAFINFDKTDRVNSREWVSWYRRKMEDFKRWVFPI